ncbi:hypothetical protein LPJ66_007873 [Kickxella alabastrina]|uniref:Uncharacterized protein n=1 Tax=Kickxella alabastrina TaxID=61397 RepID=A0ACC1IDT7_9FUNG|nr:hypothetical protein LPJ66_007873 [Kickxella alabastrina]
MLVSLAAGATICNGHEELCSRAFNEITHISTHASFAKTEPSRPSVPGTQYKTIEEQLDDGVRGLHLNIHQGSSASEVVLCYPDCNVNNGGTLTSTLKVVKQWLDNNTNDVVTIFLEGIATDANPAAVVKAFTDSGADKYILKGKPASWPTLGSMISSGTTLVVFVEEPAIAATDTNGYFITYPNTVLKLDGPFNYGNEWTCGPWNRSTESILVIPHFIVQTATYKGVTYNNMPYPFNLDTTNGYQYEAHAVNCRGGQSIWVNFIEIDFYDQGDVKTPTLKLNELPYPGDEIKNFYPEFYDADPDVPIV